MFNEIRAKNPSFTPPIDDSPVETPTTESTLADLTKLIEENKLEKKIDRLSRFLNAEILKKKPTIGQIQTTTIDLSETKKTFVFRFFAHHRHSELLLLLQSDRENERTRADRLAGRE